MDVFPPFVHYSVARMVMPYTHGMPAAEVRSATNAAVQAIKEAMSALKMIEEVTAKIMKATCDPDLLDPSKAQRNLEKGEPYPLNPRPDEAMSNIAKVFAGVIGTEQKRVAAYENHIKTAKKRKKKLAVPAASLPLSSLKGNEVIRTILDMSDKLGPVLDRMGIGPNSKKEQLQELKRDPMFRSLRSMDRSSSFGEDEDEDGDESTKLGAFSPPPEPNSGTNNGPVMGPPVGHDLYTYQAPNPTMGNQPYYQMGGQMMMPQSGMWPPPQNPQMMTMMHQDPRMMMTHQDPRMMMMMPTGPLAQKTGLLFGFLDTQNSVVKFMLVSVGIFVGYMLVCTFLTHVVEGTWYLCGFYERFMQFFFPGAENVKRWAPQVNSNQAARIIANRVVAKATGITNAVKRASLKSSIEEALRNQDGLIDVLKQVRTLDGFADLAFPTSVLSAIASSSGLVGDDTLKYVKDAFKETLAPKDLIENDAMIMLLPSFLGVEKTSAASMTALFVAVVASTFFMFFGARKRFYLTPLVTFAAGYAISLSTTSTSDNIKRFGDLAAQNATITLTVVGAILTFVTKMSSGSGTSDAMSVAMGTMAMSLNDEVERRRNEQYYRQMQIANLEATGPFLAARYLKDSVAPFAPPYLLGLAEAAKSFVGYKS